MTPKPSNPHKSRNSQFFRAIDGRAQWDNLQKTVNIDAFERNTGRTIMPAEIGCSHSHLAVWRQLCESEFQCGLVLEDDVVFGGDFPNAVSCAIEAIDKWDILKLNVIRAKWPRPRGTAGPYQLQAYLGSFTGMGAYLITKAAAQRLLPAMLPIMRPIDHELDRSFAHNIRHYGLTPYPSHVDDGENSTITGTRYSNVKKFPAWQRLPNYASRASNLLSKITYFARGG